MCQEIIVLDRLIFESNSRMGGQCHAYLFSDGEGSRLRLPFGAPRAEQKACGRPDHVNRRAHVRTARAPFAAPGAGALPIAKPILPRRASRQSGRLAHTHPEIPFENRNGRIDARLTLNGIQPGRSDGGSPACGGFVGLDSGESSRETAMASRDARRIKRGPSRPPVIGITSLSKRSRLYLLPPRLDSCFGCSPSELPFTGTTLVIASRRFSSKKGLLMTQSTPESGLPDACNISA